MILSEFSKYLKQFDDEIIGCKTTTTEILTNWLVEILSREPKTNPEKIIHEEICFEKDEFGKYSFLPKSKSGAVLLKSLNSYILSYDNFLMSKWIADKKPSDFIKR